jgi:uridine kinase
MKKPFIISISGISGSGKTAVANALKARLTNAAVISFDDYGDHVYLDRDIIEYMKEF